MLCAQCHGVDRFGNGVIAEWIYPIPKNLHNAEFLRNLSKEQTVFSIMHGVKGTPMPPWAEVAADKPVDIHHSSQQMSLMNQAEIEYMVNWLFSSLPGGEVIRQATDIPKWEYTSQDVTEELTQEGGQLLPHSDHNNEAGAIFTRVPKFTDTGAESYYINKKFYTPQNIEAGREFFLTNCAVCHGNEADGNSLRATVMQEAKPRILTNLDWIQSRDDLRLLRSIKYGIPGTGMTPWGDLTNSLQRLQLVMFIRSLSQQQERREQLMTAVYEVFDNAQIVVEHARIENSKQITKLQEERTNLQQLADNSKKEVVENPEAIKVALLAYQRALELEQKLGNLHKEDQKCLDVQASLKKEKNIYFNLGVNLITKEVSDDAFRNYLDIIRANGNRYVYDEPLLNSSEGQQQDERIQASQQKVLNALDVQISEFERQSKLVEAEGYKKLRDKFITDLKEALQLKHVAVKGKLF